MSSNRRNGDVVSDMPPLSMKELAKVLAKHYGLDEQGSYYVGVEFQIGTGPVGPEGSELLPGLVFGVKSVGLSNAKKGDGEVPTDVPQDVSTAPAKRVRKPKPSSE